MRISVCEFLRLSTGKAWCFLQPGIWISDKWALEAHRDPSDPDILHLYEGATNKLVETLEYWAGPSSHDVRAKNRQLIIKIRTKGERK